MWRFNEGESLMSENPPIMVLEGDANGRVTFRFRGNRWAVWTLIPGVALVGMVWNLYRGGNPSHGLQGVTGLFGLLLIYSSVYSITADQWLAADENKKTVEFYKKNWNWRKW